MTYVHPLMAIHHLDVSSVPEAKVANIILLDLRRTDHRGSFPPYIKAYNKHIHFAYGLPYTQQNY